MKLQTKKQIVGICLMTIYCLLAFLVDQMWAITLGGVTAILMITCLQNYKEVKTNV